VISVLAEEPLPFPPSICKAWLPDWAPLKRKLIWLLGPMSQPDAEVFGQPLLAPLVPTLLVMSPLV
jgi:hypothetical protein